MLVIRYPGAEEKTKELGKFLLRSTLLPPSASPNVNLPQTPTPDTDSYPSHTPLSCPDSHNSRNSFRFQSILFLCLINILPKIHLSEHLLRYQFKSAPKSLKNIRTSDANKINLLW